MEKEYCQYIVALAVGGLMEQPDIIYQDFMLIDNVSSKKEAVEKYNKIKNASYFYGECIGCYKNGELEVYADSKNILKTLMQMVYDKQNGRI